MATHVSPSLAILDSAPNPPSELLQAPALAPTVVSSALARTCLQVWFRLIDLWLMLSTLRNPAKAWRAMKQLGEMRKQFHSDFPARKVARVAGRYYRGYHAPGWPSAAYRAHFLNNANRLAPFRGDATTLDMAVIAITKKCPLSCEHCFEWDHLNQTEKLSLDDIKTIVRRFQDRHVSRILLSGGEPMLRHSEILEVLRSARPGTDFWILTSGFHCPLEKAQQLKAAGLTGLAVSLDHFEPERHNAFRGSPKAWDSAINAVCCARQVGLVVNLSLTVTKEFVSDENLLNYLRLAKQLGVTFVQLLEPRSVGHYAEKNVDLETPQIEVLDRFYEMVNYTDEYLAWPIVTYSGYQQRRQGCSGAGNRFLYVDTDGDLHACPFCQKKCGSALDGDECSLDASIGGVRQAGCHKFESSPH